MSLTPCVFRGNYRCFLSTGYIELNIGSRNNLDRANVMPYHVYTTWASLISVSTRRMFRSPTFRQRLYTWIASFRPISVDGGKCHKSSSVTISCCTIRYSFITYAALLSIVVALAKLTLHLSPRMYPVSVQNYVFTDANRNSSRL